MRARFVFAERRGSFVLGSHGQERWEVDFRGTRIPNNPHDRDRRFRSAQG